MPGLSLHPGAHLALLLVLMLAHTAGAIPADDDRPAQGDVLEGQGNRTTSDGAGDATVGFEPTNPPARAVHDRDRASQTTAAASGPLVALAVITLGAISLSFTRGQERT